LDIPGLYISQGGALPPVCDRHGEPASEQRPTVFISNTPRWVSVLVVVGLFTVGLLLAIIVAAAVRKRVKAPAWPFCSRCAALRKRRLWTAIGTLVLAVLIIVLLMLAPGDSSYAGLVGLADVLLFIVGLGLFGYVRRGAIALGRVSTDGTTVHLRRPHPRFAEQLAHVMPPPLPPQAPQAQSFRG
jgi:hypothetical protein